MIAQTTSEARERPTAALTRTGQLVALLVGPERARPSLSAADRERVLGHLENFRGRLAGAPVSTGSPA